jgi:hypothetical protein
MISRISAGLHLVGLAGFPVHGVSVAGEDKEYYSSFVQLRSFLFINEYFINLSSVPTDRDMISRSLLVWMFFALATATKTYDGKYTHFSFLPTIRLLNGKCRAKSRSP